MFFTMKGGFFVSSVVILGAARRITEHTDDEMQLAGVLGAMVTQAVSKGTAAAAAAATETAAPATAATLSEGCQVAVTPVADGWEPECDETTEFITMTSFTGLSAACNSGDKQIALETYKAEVAGQKWGAEKVLARKAEVNGDEIRSPCSKGNEAIDCSAYYPRLMWTFGQSDANDLAAALLRYLNVPCLAANQDDPDACKPFTTDITGMELMELDYVHAAQIMQADFTDATFTGPPDGVLSAGELAAAFAACVPTAMEAVMLMTSKVYEKGTKAAFEACMQAAIAEGKEGDAAMAAGASAATTAAAGLNQQLGYDTTPLSASEIRLQFLEVSATLQKLIAVVENFTNQAVAQWAAQPLV